MVNVATITLTSATGIVTFTPIAHCRAFAHVGELPGSHQVAGSTMPGAWTKSVEYTERERAWRLAGLADALHRHFA